ncbi:single hybrid motif-containing protein [Pelagophyceae sp. CCMP2097]|nr:single hybrid motif-containing protein [Pelagophyceae sp. CCMP2097]
MLRVCLRLAPAARGFSAPLKRCLSLPSHAVVGMPALSPTMEAGTIAVWKVAEGAAFAAGDVICEIETDKATVDFEAQDEGVLAKILALAGVEVAVGAPICVTVDDIADADAFADFSAPAAGAAAPAPAPVAAAAPVAAPVAASVAAPAVAPKAPVAAPVAAAAPVAVAAPAPPVTAAAGTSTHVFVRADADKPIISGPLASIVEKSKAAYHAKYGQTGF